MFIGYQLNLVKGMVMSLLSQRTKWVLFLSDPEPEIRFMADLAFGVKCLEDAGVNNSDIFVYMDGQPAQVSGVLALGSDHQYQIKTSDEFFTDSVNNTHENMVMFVTGHGSPHGIHGVVPITPNRLVSCIKNMPALNNAIVYLGQCYAGLFNYVNAGREGESADIIFVGATNLHESLSLSTTEQFLHQPITWFANVFLLHIFKWISSPSDVDGDGRVTVMDSYKYAGVHSNISNKLFKTQCFSEMVDQHHEYKQLEAIASVSTGNPTIDMSNRIDLQAAHEKYQHSLGTHYVHQECWILNSRPAQQIEF